MNILKNLFLFNKKNDNSRVMDHEVVDNFKEIAMLVKEARIQKNITIQELSYISKIPEQTIYAIENNQNNRPKYPFIRSILIELEKCLELKKNTLVKLAIRGKENFKREKQDLQFFSKFDLLNTWQGIILYFFILVITLFILKRYFILNVNFIEIQNIENKSLKNNL